MAPCACQVFPHIGITSLVAKSNSPGHLHNGRSILPSASSTTERNSELRGIKCSHGKMVLFPATLKAFPSYDQHKLLPPLFNEYSKRISLGTQIYKIPMIKMSQS